MRKVGLEGMLNLKKPEQGPYQFIATTFFFVFT